MSLNEEPVQKCAGSKDGVKSVEGDEATPMPPIEHQGRTEHFVPGGYIECHNKDKYGATTSKDGNKFFDSD